MRNTDDPDAMEEPSLSPSNSPKSAADYYRAQPVLNRRIHILGVGNVGSFIAHSLRGIPNPPPVTLIFHRPDKLREWNKSRQNLSLVTDGITEVHDGYDAELSIPRTRYHGKEVERSETARDLEDATVPQDSEAQNPTGVSTESIHSLIVGSKTPYVLQALSAVKHRLHKDSVICFLQNGMGTVEEVNREIFPDPDTRPYYMIGINSHGMHASKEGAFTTVRGGFGTISLGLLPHERERSPEAPYSPLAKFKAGGDGKPVDYQQAVRPEESIESTTPPPATTNFTWTTNQRYLLRTLLRSPVLAATPFSPPDLLQLQLEKLAVNCIVNPLTVMLDAPNGSILYNYPITRVMRLLLSEISLVIRSLPELQHIPNVQQRFDPGRLETIVVGVAQKTRDNISSMLADARAGNRTEIDYINGWIVRRGEGLGIRCMMNYMLLQMVKGKGNMIQLELAEGVPFVQEGVGNVKINQDESSSLEE